MDKRIATYLALGKNGRCCNAYFQVAATIAFSLDHGKDFAFPDWVYSRYMKKELPVCGMLDAINVPIQFHHAPIEDYPGNHVNLCHGHAQSSKYFAHHWETIKPYLTIKDEYMAAVRAKYDAYLDSYDGRRTCSIHVRLTDYENPINVDYHGVMPMSYYKTAIKELYGNENPEDVLFFIFSDNIPRCCDTFDLPNMVFVYPDDTIVPKMKDFSGLDMGNGDLMDLFLMSMCDDNIIVNSSFSWWGAWLNQNPKKCVVAPAHWFNKAPIDYKDVVPDGWIKIDNKKLSQPGT